MALYRRLFVCTQVLCAAYGFSAINGDNSKRLDFDFSSVRGWETHYQEESSSSCSPDEAYDEWHATIDFQTIVQYCVPPIVAVEEEHPGQEGAAAQEQDPSSNHLTTSSATTNHTKIDILMVGCGTSRLPEAFDPSRFQLTLLDAAPTCIETLQSRYHEKHRYIVGDAVRMTANTTGTYHCVVDKGLMDALLCGEGWNTWVAQLLDSVANVLHPGGRYVLISYRLPTSTMAFLERRSIGTLEWDFVVDGSNPRVMISTARRAWYRTANEGVKESSEQSD